MKKVDLGRELKGLYTATSKVGEVTADRGEFLCVDGKGAPGGAEFQRAIEVLYSVAYTVKFSLKKAGLLDFTVPKLEWLWLVGDPKAIPMSQWEWRAMIRIPSEVTRAHINEAGKLVGEKKGLDVSGVRRISWREGRALQVMHTGPYDGVEEAYEKLHARADELGYRVKGRTHEIYLNDPNRVAHQKLKTIVRLPISHPRPAYARGS